MNWNESNRFRIQYIRFGERLFKTMLRDINKELRAALSDVQTTADIEGVIERFEPTVNVRDYFTRLYVHTGVGMAGKIKKDLTNSSKKTNFDSDIDIWTEQMIDFVNTRCGTKIAAITRQNYSDIERVARQAIGLGAEQGMGAEQIAKLIMNQQGEIAKWRALRIARTEVVSASNEGAMLGAESTGIEVKKIWLATGVPGPSGFMREDHDMMNEVAVDMNEPFILPDGTQMMFPGDPDPEVPASHVINCRCTVVFEPKESIIDAILRS